MKKILALVLCLTMLLGVLSYAAADTIVVPEGLVSGVYNGHTYAVVEEKMNWANAESYCESMGGHLVTITSEGENEFVVNLLSEIAVSDYEHYYIGFSDEETEGEWKWVTGEAVEYTNWGENQPDNRATGGASQNCAVIVRGFFSAGSCICYNGQWDDSGTKNSISGADRFSFICEWDETSEESTTQHQESLILTFYNGHTYAVVENKMSWRDAQNYCESISGHLVTITSQVENDYVLSLIDSYEPVSFYIGCTDSLEEGMWLWVTDEPFVYSNWGRTQPDNSLENGGPDLVGQDFGAIRNQYYEIAECLPGQWDDCSGETANYFVCEWDDIREEPVTSTTTTVPTTVVPTTTVPATTRPVTVSATERILTVEIRKPSRTEIDYGDSIILHADINGNLPNGAEIVWSSDNSNFRMISTSVDGRSCTVTPSTSGDTVFTATVYDEAGNVICSDTQTMTSKAGFFMKLVAFLKMLFGMTTVFLESLNY